MWGQSEKESDKGKDLGDEFIKVGIVVLFLANQSGVKFQEAFDKKLDIKTKDGHNRYPNNEKLK